MSFSIFLNHKKALEDVKRKLISNLEKDESKLSYKFKNDLLIYENPRADHFRLIGLANIAQYLVLVYGANFAYAFYFRKPSDVRKEMALSKNPGSNQEEEETKFDLWSFWQENKKRIATSSALMLAAHVFAFGLGFYCAKSVRYIIIRKGGQKVRLTCYSVLGMKNKYRHHDLTLDLVSCQAARNSLSGHIPVKVRGKLMYYLVDPKGHFYHPSLFDQTVGVFRGF